MAARVILRRSIHFGTSDMAVKGSDGRLAGSLALWGRVRGGDTPIAVLTNTEEGCARVSTGSVRIHGLESRRWPRGSAAGQPLIRLTTTCVDSLQMPLM